jgi:hypothetical protein
MSTPVSPTIHQGSARPSRGRPRWTATPAAKIVASSQAAGRRAEARRSRPDAAVTIVAICSADTACDGVGNPAAVSIEFARIRMMTNAIPATPARRGNDIGWAPQ